MVIILFAFIVILSVLYVFIGENEEKYHTAGRHLRGFVICDDVSVQKSEIHGLGCFARRDFKEGEIIEVGIMTPLEGVDGHINPHLFTWSDDRSVWACGSGCLPFYNHSENPNVLKKGDLKNNTMKIIALKDISKGEELTSYYYSKDWRKCFQNF